MPILGQPDETWGEGEWDSYLREKYGDESPVTSTCATGDWASRPVSYYVAQAREWDPPKTSTDEELILVQFCPCGDVGYMTRSETIALGGENQLAEIEAGTKLDAPILPSSCCPNCAISNGPEE